MPMRKRRQKCSGVSNSAILLIVFKCHHVSEGVKYIGRSATQTEKKKRKKKRKKKVVYTEALPAHLTLACLFLNKTILCPRFIFSCDERNGFLSSFPWFRAVLLLLKRVIKK